MKGDRRTSLILDSDLMQRLKEQCVDEEISMRDFIIRAAENELARSRAHKKARKNRTASVEMTDFSFRVLKQVERVTKSFLTAQAMLQKTLNKFGIPVREFSAKSLTRDFVDALCDSVGTVAKKEDSDYLNKKLKLVGKGWERL
jgi:IS1 family transposase